MKATFTFRFLVGGVDSDLVGQRGWVDRPTIPPSVLQWAGRLGTAQGVFALMDARRTGNTRKRVSKVSAQLLQEAGVRIPGFFFFLDLGITGEFVRPFYPVGYLARHDQQELLFRAFRGGLVGLFDCVMTSPFHATLSTVRSSAHDR